MYGSSSGYGTAPAYAIAQAPAYSKHAFYSSAAEQPYKSGTEPTQYNSLHDYAAGQAQVAAFSADAFLDPFRPPTPFVGRAEEIRPHVEQAFRALMDSELPSDIIVRIGTEEQLAMAYPKTWSSTIAGFALNRVGWGTSEIFVRKDDLDKVLLTIGHELGHVMSQPLQASHDEEAKAFAFGMAWMKTIKDNNIAGIGHSIVMNPAKNGLHDKAFAFVADLVVQGRRAMDVFAGLVHGMLAVR